MKLFPYQRKHVDRLIQILETRRGALDLSATGTGKTVCALTAAKELGRPAAVVAPLGTLPGWRRTAEALGVELAALVNYESVSKARGFVTPNRINLPTAALVIYDEAHKCKNWKTQNAKMMMRIAREGWKILGLSATIAHHAEHLRAWNAAFNLANTNSFSGFMSRCGYYYESNKWGGQWLPRYDDTHERTRRAIASFISGMTIEDAGAIFKGNQIIIEVVSSKEDAALAKEYLTYLQALRAKDKTANHLTAELRARQASERAKLPVVEEKVLNLLDEGYQVAVFCNFNETIDRLACQIRASQIRASQILFPSVSVIRGGQNAALRESERAAFQAGETKVIICNLQAGGVGLDLHDVNGLPRASVIMPDWSAVSIKQALGRIHRAGAKSDALQYVLFSDVPVERRMADAVEGKIKALDTLHDFDTRWMVEK